MSLTLPIKLTTTTNKTELLFKVVLGHPSPKPNQLILSTGLKHDNLILLYKLINLILIACKKNVLFC